MPTTRPTTPGCAARGLTAKRVQHLRPHIQQITDELSPEATMLAGASGSGVVKYVNSSYFWVCTSLSRMPLRSALFSYGAVTLVGGIGSMTTVYALWAAGIL